MEYIIKNGLFKHQLDSKDKLVAVKLFVNGWAITDTIGNTKASIHKEENGVKSETWSASFVQEETAALRVAGIKEVVLAHKDGKEFHFLKEKGNFLLHQEDKTWKIEGVESRRSTLDLPKEFTALDAMVLFCILKISNETVGVV